MRTMRILIAVVALSMVAVACGDDDGATTTQPDGSNGTVATTTATTAGSNGGATTGSINFEITGDYETSGDFPFIALASAFSNGGWSATFGEDGSDAIVIMNTIPGSLSVSYGDVEVVITAIEVTGCDFDLTENAATGLVGSFDCTAAGFRSQSGAQITVRFRGDFSSR